MSAAAAAAIWLRGGGIQPRGQGVIPPPSSFLAAFSGSLNARVCGRHNKALYIPQGCQEIQGCSGGPAPQNQGWGSGGEVGGAPSFPPTALGVKLGV